MPHFTAGETQARRLTLANKQQSPYSSPDSLGSDSRFRAMCDAVSHREEIWVAQTREAVGELARREQSQDTFSRQNWQDTNCM